MPHSCGSHSLFIARTDMVVTVAELACAMNEHGVCQAYLYVWHIVHCSALAVPMLIIPTFIVRRGRFGVISIVYMADDYTLYPDLLADACTCTTIIIYYCASYTVVYIRLELDIMSLF